jgi:serine/threonine protein kinase
MDERSALASALSGRYEIDREIGRGGMATVYLARDLRHERPVAVKLLNPELGAVLGAERFLSEIRVTANLQHPNLLPLFDSGEANGLLFYVMPYVEGESLRARLDRENQLPIDDAVRIAAAIAGALDYAHRHGVIHRDLKPENVLLHDGQPLVADFGIALAVSKAGGARVTQTGLSLGTPQYMSPEQATGDRAIDSRTDIYSLGALTYEMLAGEPPHSGATAQAIIARLMTEDPRPLTTTRRNVPAQVDAAVRHALEKLPADRFATAKEFADALQGRGGPPTYAQSSDASSRHARRRLLTTIAATAIVSTGLAGVAFARWRPTSTASSTALAEPTRFFIDPPAGLTISDFTPERPFAISPDGQTVVFTAGADGQLFARHLDRLEPTAVAGVDVPMEMAFSPEGDAVAFKKNGALWRVPVAGQDVGSAPAKLADSAFGSTVAWTHHRDLVYATRGALWRVTPGNKPRIFALLDSAVDRGWTNASILSDGKTVAFRVTPRGAVNGTTRDRLALISIDGGEHTLLDVEGQNVVGYVDGILIYGRVDGRIAGVRCDLRARKVLGQPVTLMENVSWKPSSGVTAALSATGSLVYLTGRAKTIVQLVDERGKTAVLDAEPQYYNYVNWMPDGRRLLLGSTASIGSDVAIYDVDSRVTTWLTHSGNVASPSMTRDGKRVSFALFRSGGATPYWMPADGSAAPESLAIAVRAGIHGFFAFSADGKYLIGTERPQDSRMLAVPLDGATPRQILAGERAPGLPKVSPDGRWMAYSAGDQTHREVFVAAFPEGVGRVQVSSSGGFSPSWSSDGTRLYYETKASVRSVSMSFNADTPRVISTDSLLGGVFVDYDANPKGSGIVVLRATGEGAKIVVVTNWMTEVMAKMGKP